MAKHVHLTAKHNEILAKAITIILIFITVVILNSHAVSENTLRLIYKMV